MEQIPTEGMDTGKAVGPGKSVNRDLGKTLRPMGGGSTRP